MAIQEFTITEVELINFKKRKYVRNMVANAVRNGKLIRPQCCELCQQKAKIEAHHIDYGRPMFVSWLCRACHVKAHSKDHPLNPDNNPQSPMPYLVQEYKKVHVTFQLPIRTFLALQEASQKTGKPIGVIMREQAEMAFPVYDPQMKFNLEIQHDKPQDVEHQRVQSVETNEGLRKQPKRAVLQTVRGARNYNMQGVESQFFAISGGHGRNAERLQRSVANR